MKKTLDKFVFKSFTKENFLFLLGLSFQRIAFAHEHSLPELILSTPILIMDNITNPEPIESFSNFLWKKPEIATPIIAGQSLDNQEIYYCATRPREGNRLNASLGITNSLKSPCYIFYENHHFQQPQKIVDKDIYILAEKSDLFSTFNWSKPIHRRTKGHNTVVMMSGVDDSDRVFLCRVFSDGKIFPGFSINTNAKNIAKGNAICFFRKSLLNDAIYQAPSSEFLYSGRK